jgi:LPXTG-site transpeptidase (sortase) family protein
MRTTFNTIWKHKLTFFGVYFLVFLLTYLVLVAVDFIPEPPESESEVIEATSSMVREDTLPPAPEVVTPAETEPVLPTQIYIERLGKTIEVLNPNSRNIAELDKALLSGVVRHPDSAHMEQLGNVFILGHSSYLPNVLNPNFQAFNGIQNLKWGDVIEVQSDGMAYVYRVERVYEANAQELVVPIAVDEKLLTLATCDSFGSVEDRFIVEAKQIEVRET